MQTAGCGRGPGRPIHLHRNSPTEIRHRRDDWRGGRGSAPAGSGQRRHNPSSQLLSTTVKYPTSGQGAGILDQVVAGEQTSKTESRKDSSSAFIGGSRCDAARGTVPTMEFEEGTADAMLCFRAIQADLPVQRMREWRWQLGSQLVLGEKRAHVGDGRVIGRGRTGGERVRERSGTSAAAGRSWPPPVRPWPAAALHRGKVLAQRIHSLWARRGEQEPMKGDRLIERDLRSGAVEDSPTLHGDQEEDQRVFAGLFEHRQAARARSKESSLGAGGHLEVTKAPVAALG